MERERWREPRYSGLTAKAMKLTLLITSGEFSNLGEFLDLETRLMQEKHFMELFSFL